MKLSELKAIIRECIKELDESEPKRFDIRKEAMIRKKEPRKKK